MIRQQRLIPQNSRRRRLLQGDTSQRPPPRQTNIFPPRILPLPLLFGTSVVKRNCRFFQEAVQDLIETRDQFKNIYLISKDTHEILERDYNTQIEWLQREQVCRTVFRRFVQLWLQKKQSKRILNTEDPATLSEPVKKVVIYDLKSRGIFQQEASTLKKTIEKDLSQAEWMFPETREPKNPFTNLPFTHAQMCIILEQLRSHQQTSWILESQRAKLFDVKSFREAYMVPLKLRALSDLLRNSTSEEAITLFHEFIEEQYDYHQLDNITALANLVWAVKKGIENPQIQQWRDMFAKFQNYQILQGRKFILENEGLRQEVQDSTQDLFQEKQELSELARLRQGANKGSIPNTLRIANTFVLTFPIAPLVPAPTVWEQDGDEEEKVAEEEDDLFNLD